MSEREIRYRVHALLRMAERRISPEDVREILASGETIESYPEDRPYPSRLVLGYPGGRPLHLVAADADDLNRTIIVTVYEPDPELWDPTFRRRTKR